MNDLHEIANGLGFSIEARTSLETLPDLPEKTVHKMKKPHLFIEWLAYPDYESNIVLNEDIGLVLGRVDKDTLPNMILQAYLHGQETSCKAEPKTYSNKDGGYIISSYSSLSAIIDRVIYLAKRHKELYNGLIEHFGS